MDVCSQFLFINLEGEGKMLKIFSFAKYTFLMLQCINFSANFKNVNGVY
jgi:hypothetical protein